MFALPQDELSRPGTGSVELCGSCRKVYLALRHDSFTRREELRSLEKLNSLRRQQALLLVNSILTRRQDLLPISHDGLVSGGVGVLGEALNGYGVKAVGGIAALDVHGPAIFDRSGLNTVPANSKSMTLGPIPLGPNSMVLAMVQRNAGGAFVKSAIPSPSNSTITINLDKIRTISVPVAWFILG